MRPRIALGLSILLLLLTLIPDTHAAYRITVEQLQPVTPYPGDTVVFKITLLNEASWSGVLYAEVMSPEGIVYQVDSIRMRAGNYLPNTEYVSFTIPENALPGNYTLSLRSHDYIFNEASFYVFEKKREGLFVAMSYENSTLTLSITSPMLIRGLRVELLDQLPRKVEQNGNTSKVTFLPVSFRPLGQSYRYLGDVANATVSFSIAPLEGYVRIPVKLTWQEGENIMTWSGYAALPAPVSDAAPQNSATPEPEGLTPGNKGLSIDGFTLPAAAFLLILPSVLVWAKRRNRGISLQSFVRSCLGRRSRLFEGGEDEAGEKWAWVEKCIMELKHTSGKGRIKKALLVKELCRRLSPREADAVVGYLVKTGELAVKDEHIEVKGRWQENL